MSTTFSGCSTKVSSAVRASPSVLFSSRPTRSSVCKATSGIYGATSVLRGELNGSGTRGIAGRGLRRTHAGGGGRRRRDGRTGRGNLARHGRPGQAEAGSRLAHRRRQLRKLGDAL